MKLFSNGIHLAWRSYKEIKILIKKMNPLMVHTLKYGILHKIESLLCP